MPDKPVPTTEVKATGDTPPAAGAPPVPPRRSPGHRGADVRDTVAEMAAKAQEISQEAGSKMAAAMKDVINAAAGIAGFAVESARDLVQYMVRRGQMTQEEADKLIREAEAAQVGRPQLPPRPAAPKPASPTPAAAVPAPTEMPVRSATPVAPRAVAPPPPPTPAPAPKAPAPAPAAVKKAAPPPPPKAAAKKAAPPPKKTAAKPAPKAAAKKGAAAKGAKKR
jgi:polyhydroxyalkanoate synthesis regulator phasin